MSRLAARIARLEQVLPACPECSDGGMRIGIVTPARPDRGTGEPVCGGCGQPLERALVLLAFNLDADKEACQEER